MTDSAGRWQSEPPPPDEEPVRVPVITPPAPPTNAEYARRLSPNFETNQLLRELITEVKELRRALSEYLTCP